MKIINSIIIHRFYSWHNFVFNVVWLVNFDTLQGTIYEEFTLH